MGEDYADKWSLALPWVLLGRRTSFQPELDATPAELVYGEPLKVPGDLAGADLQPDSNLPTLLERIRKNAARPPVPTAHHNNEPYVHLPSAMQGAKYVYTRRGKVTPLGPRFDGPWPIIERQGDHCVKIRAGYYNNGEPRYELHHWNNIKIAPSNLTEADVATRPTLGRKRKNDRQNADRQTSNETPAGQKE